MASEGREFPPGGETRPSGGGTKPPGGETKPPVFESPLIIEPTQTQGPLTLGNLAPLVGTWVNAKDTFGYNVMPLPQVNDEDGPWKPGYILKNTPYYEELTFSAINGNAPNRGGLGTQVCNTLFYEQRVYFTEGPNVNQLVHAENGSWLNFTSRVQYAGPYGDTPMKDSKPPDIEFNVAKQMSVPHGNSILAVGNSIKDSSGNSPIIPITPEVIPPGIDGSQYAQRSEGNPNVELTNNPNLLIGKVLTEKKISEFIAIQVDSKSLGIPPTNIGFENKHAKVTRYQQDMWLLAPVAEPGNFNCLLYTQTIRFDLIINGQTVNFPHITSNTLVRKTF